MTPATDRRLNPMSDRQGRPVVPVGATGGTWGQAPITRSRAAPHAKRIMAEVLLLQDASAGCRNVVVHHVRRADRIAARLRGLDLDRQLAAGTPPESSAALTLRARKLLRPTERKRMARGLRGLVRQAQRPPSVPAGVPLARRQVLRAAPQIDRLADRLDRAEPLDVRGLALARLLITDGTGPLYSAGQAGNVRDAVDNALDALSAEYKTVGDD